MTWKRDVVICAACAPNMYNDCLREPQDVRLCDYAVDPLVVSSSTAGQTLSVCYEKWHDHDPDSAPSMDGPVDMRSYVLGRSVEDFASPVAALTDHEEMVLALVHPLVQVYTIPRTGQLAYVGHICNFRQKVPKFFSSLPILPHDMPFVMVRPRSFRNQPSNRPPFKVNIHKLREAFAWLQKHNPYYHGIEWSQRGRRG